MVWLELITQTLFLLWIFGCISVLADLDHIWFRLGRDEPFNVTHWPGRCLHHPVIYLVISLLLGIFILPSVFRFYVQVSGQIGALATLLGEAVIIVVSIVVLYLFDKRTKSFLEEKKLCKGLI